MPNPVPQSLLVGDVDIGRQAVTTINSLNTTAQRISDPASATSALSKLQDGAKDLERFAGLSLQLPMPGRAALADLVAAPDARLRATLGKIADSPEAMQVTRPAIRGLREALDVMAMAPSTHGDVTYFARPGSGWLSIGAHNRDVYNRAGEKVGAVNDLLVAPNGQVAATVIGTGGFLGFGERQIAMPFSASQVTRKETGWNLVVDASRDTLLTAPAFELPAAAKR